MIQPSVWWDDKGGCDTHGHTMLPEAQSPPAAHTRSLWGTNPGNSNEPAKCLSSIDTPWVYCGPSLQGPNGSQGKRGRFTTIVHIYTHLNHPDESFPEIFWVIQSKLGSRQGGRSCWPMRTWLSRGSANSRHVERRVSQDGGSLEEWSPKWRNQQLAEICCSQKSGHCIQQAWWMSEGPTPRERAEQECLNRLCYPILIKPCCDNTSSSTAIVKMIITFSDNLSNIMYPIYKGSTKGCLAKAYFPHIACFLCDWWCGTHNVMHTSKASAEKPALFLITDNYCICTPRTLEE